MDRALKLFHFGTKNVRVLMKDGEPWFVAKDVCDILEITNSRDAVGRLDPDEKGVVLTDTPGGPQEVQAVNESGLYSLILGSRKPEAKAFKRWVTHEVLPSIRKHGMYATDELLENPDLLIKVATKLKEEREARLLAEAKLEEQKPLVGFAETCLASKDSILIRELAKVASKHGIVIGEKRLYKKLREWGLILKGRTEPMQSAIDAGYFEVVQSGKETSYGNMIFRTTRVTPKGQVYIIERLKREQTA